MEDYDSIARKVKELIIEEWDKAQVYVFGSVTERKQTGMSDIDILVVIDEISREEALKLKAKVYQKIDAPLEIHVVSSSEYERWYKKFVGKIEKV